MTSGVFAAKGGRRKKKEGEDGSAYTLMMCPLASCLSGDSSSGFGILFGGERRGKKEGKEKREIREIYPINDEIPPFRSIPPTLAERHS